MIGDEQKTAYSVVLNHEEQYSIWRLGREIPKGWRNAGKTGTKQECLDWVKENWTDMRPLSIRRSTEIPTTSIADSVH
jgi:MbtH protein